MRTRTIVVAGTGAAAVVYLFEPRGGKARRDRIVPRSGRSRVGEPSRSNRVPPTPEASRAEPISVPTRPPSGTSPSRREPERRRGGRRDRSRRQDEAPGTARPQDRRSRGRRGQRRGVPLGRPACADFGEVVDLTGLVPGVRRVQSLLHLPHSETISGQRREWQSASRGVVRLPSLSCSPRVVVRLLALDDRSEQEPSSANPACPEVWAITVSRAPSAAWAFGASILALKRGSPLSGSRAASTSSTIS